MNACNEEIRARIDGAIIITALGNGIVFGRAVDCARWSVSVLNRSIGNGVARRGTRNTGLTDRRCQEGRPIFDDFLQVRRGGGGEKHYGCRARTGASRLNNIKVLGVDVWYGTEIDNIVMILTIVSVAVGTFIVHAG